MNKPPPLIPEVIEQFAAAQTAALNAIDALAELSDALESLEIEHPIHQKLWPHLIEARRIGREPTRIFLSVLHNLNDVIQNAIDAARVAMERIRSRRDADQGGVG